MRQSWRPLKGLLFRPRLIHYSRIHPEKPIQRPGVTPRPLIVVSYEDPPRPKRGAYQRRGRAPEVPAPRPAEVRRLEEFFDGEPEPPALVFDY